MGKKTKIDWADSTWSPVVGCRNGCPYCYAKRIADRFAGFDKTEENLHKYAITGYKGQNIYTVNTPMTKSAFPSYDEIRAVYPFGFAPTLLSYMLKEPQTWKEPKDIFVCSMADLFGDWIPVDWIAKVFNACMDAPQHRYFFLTKNPARYIELFEKGYIQPGHDNWWFGTTLTTIEDQYFFRDDANCFLSIEPIHSDFPIDLIPLKDYGIKWVIVGAETGNRVGKIKPEKEWIENIMTICRINDIPIFMKDSLKQLMGKDFVQEKP